MFTLTAPATAPARVGAPWTVRVLAGVVLALAAVTSYGAIYFSFFFEKEILTSNSSPISRLNLTLFLVSLAAS